MRHFVNDNDELLNDKDKENQRKTVIDWKEEMDRAYFELITLGAEI
jgi:hypothetical protein